MNGEGNLPCLKITQSVCKINMIKNVLKLVVAVIWLVIIVVGLALLFM